MTIAMMIATIAVFAQMEITKNKLILGGEFDYWMTTTDPSQEGMSFTIPGAMYQFETKPNDMFKLYLHGMVAYQMYKNTVDGEAADPFDVFGSNLYLSLDPMVKAYLPNNLFVKVGLPFDYISMTPQVEDADAIGVQMLDMWAEFGFDNREIEIHGLTPWDKFEKGMAFYGVYEMGIMASVDGTDAEELPSYFGIKGCYAHYADAMMIKPYLSYKMGMNDKIDENGYFNIGARFVKDLNEQMNIDAGLDFGMKMLPEKDDADNDAYNTLVLDAQFNYYVMPELNVYGLFNMNMDLTTEDAEPVYALGLGAVYTMNLLK